MRLAQWLSLAMATVTAGTIGLICFVLRTAIGLALDLERYRSDLVRKQVDLPGRLRYLYLEVAAHH